MKLNSGKDFGHATRLELDARGNPIKIADPDGYSLGFEYDAMDRWVVAYDKEGNAVTRSLDISGRVRAVTDPNGNVTRTTWYGASKNGRVKEQIDPQGRKTTHDYDANGNRISLTDNAGQTSRTFYDALNRPVRSIGPLVDGIYPVTCVKFDLLDHPVELWAGSTTDTASPACDLTGADANLKKQASYVHNDLGWKIAETDPLGQTWTWAYDRHGNPLTQTDAKGQKTELTWDYGHQMKTRTVRHADGSPYQTQTVVRNPIGQPVSRIQSAPAMHQTWAYDPAHRLLEETETRAGGVAKALRYDWSPGGLLNTMEDSDGHRTDCLWDAVGNLAGIWAPNFDYLAFSHDAGGRLTEKWHASGHTTRYTWNPDGSLAKLVNRTAASTILSSHTYQYDTLLGRRYRHTEAIGILGTRYNQYVFDPLGRLTQSQTCTASNYATCSADETLTYDIWDNRKTRTTASGTVAYLLDATHQLKETRSGSDTGPLLASYAWDDNGNQTSRPGQTLTWNPANQLVGIDSDSYQYDSQGRRIRKTSGGVTTSWRYNGDDIHAEWNAATPVGAPQFVYVHGGGIDDPLMRLTGDTAGPTATASRYHPDGLGSLVAQTTNSGATQGLQRFDAWGNKTQSSGMIDQYGYTGREPDATGLIYYRARYYDPTTGRFISRDPAGMPDGVNRYAYVGNNPVNFIDPSGLVDIFVHGSNVFGKLDQSSTAWWRSGSTFAQSIQGVTGDPNQLSFGWSGGNDNASRQQAAQSLAGVVNGYLAQGEPVNIYAHSHGGNVVALASQQFSSPVQMVVTMGTPVREEYPMNMNNIQLGIALSSPNDKVQTNGGGAYGFLGIGEFGSAGRERPGFTNVVSSDYSGHSDYHESADLTAWAIGTLRNAPATSGSQSLPVTANPNMGKSGYSSGGASNLPYKFNY